LTRRSCAVGSSRATILLCTAGRGRLGPRGILERFLYPSPPLFGLEFSGTLLVDFFLCKIVCGTTSYLDFSFQSNISTHPGRTYQHIAYPILPCNLVNTKTLPTREQLRFIPERSDLALRQQGSSARVDRLLTVFISEDGECALQ
jgi:hypothetical protein